MMLKITSRCSMGCTHCMNDAQCPGEDMDLELMDYAMDFVQLYGGPFLIVSGGEPTQHKDFMGAMRVLKNRYASAPSFSPIYITVTTNGLWLQEHYDEFLILKNEFKHGPLEEHETLLWQVTNDPRYYPVSLDMTNPVFEEDSVMVFNEVPQIYPQGRAVKNNLPWKAKASKCFNIRSITHQMVDRYRRADLRDILLTLVSHNKFCTPHIDINGNIKLGESDLCPVCSNIFKSSDKIVDDIYFFRCNKCKHINDKLSDEYKSLIGE